METMTRVKIGIAVALAVIVIILVAQNAAPVNLKILFIDIPNTPLFVVVLISLALGFLLGWLTAVLLRRRREKLGA